MYQSLCLLPFPSQDVERHSRPEIEFGTNTELLLPPVSVTRKSGEACLIEPSINSCRVSFRFRGGDTLDELLGSSFFRFLMLHAEELSILRRNAVTDYHVSFLVTDAHTTRFKVMDIIQFFVTFAIEVPAFLRELKLAVGTQNREVTADFMRSLSGMPIRTAPQS